MKIAALSDIHGRLVSVPECDLCIIAGDICPIENHDVRFQENWLDTVFRNWLEQIPTKKIIGIAGNHDLVFDHGNHPDLPWTYLENTLCEYQGIKIFGTPYQSKFGGWPFMRTEWELQRLWAEMPKCDIIVSHGPPLGAGDYCNNTLTGMIALKEKIEDLKIRYCICGHIHENYGEHSLGDCKVLNVALCNNKYKIQYQPFMFDIENPVLEDHQLSLKNQFVPPFV